MTEQLLRELIQSVEELREKWLDDVHEARELGDDAGALQAMKYARGEASLARKARKVLLCYMVAV